MQTYSKVERMDIMNYSIDEQKALQRLNVGSFREVTKDRLVELMSMIPDMSPEVAKKALEQIPNFTSNSTKVLGELKGALMTSIASEDKALDAVTKSRFNTIDCLCKLLESEELSFEQKMLVVENINLLNDKNSQDYERHQNFLIEGIRTLAVPCMFFIAGTLSLLGLKANVKH